LGGRFDQNNDSRKTMSFICGDCKKEHPVPTPQEVMDGAPCFDALLRDRDRLQLQVSEYRKALKSLDAMRKRLPDPDFNEQRNTAAAIAEIIQAAISEQQ